VATGSSLNNLVPIERFWLPFGDTYPVDENGWLLDPAAQGIFQATHVLTTEIVAQSQCAVLLGEPGMGKSSVLRLQDPLMPSGAAAGLHWTVDLSPFASEDRLVRTVFENRRLADWDLGSETFCLTLDGFDEAHKRIDNLHRILAQYLSEWDCSRLNLRIGCRAAEWPNSLTRALEGEFDHADIFELLPLRRMDAELLLPASVVTEDFVQAVETARAGPLASRPLTLSLLAASFERNGGLPEGAADLYSTGLLALCDELNPQRRDADRTSDDPGERFRAAMRIAALSVFSDVAGARPGEPRPRRPPCPRQPAVERQDSHRTPS
jgi:hypothetical protein